MKDSDDDYTYWEDDGGIDVIELEKKEKEMNKKESKKWNSYAVPDLVVPNFIGKDEREVIQAMENIISQVNMQRVMMLPFNEQQKHRKNEYDKHVKTVAKQYGFPPTVKDLVQSEKCKLIKTSSLDKVIKPYTKSVKYYYSFLESEIFRVLNPYESEEFAQFVLNTVFPYVIVVFELEEGYKLIKVLSNVRYGVYQDEFEGETYPSIFINSVETDTNLLYKE